MTNSNHICQCVFCDRILDEAHYFCCEMNQSFLDELGYWSPSRLSQYCWKCIEQRKESLAKKELNPKLYCLENNCHAELTNNDQEYCSKHENICPAYACASRNVIVALDYHCFKHKNKCFSTNCFKRVSFEMESCQDCQQKLLKKIYQELEEEKIKENKKQQEHNQLKSLVIRRTNISGSIEAVDRFKTNWNNNLATVIAYYDNYYQVFFLVYDNKVYVFPTNHFESKWGISNRKQHNYLSGAQEEAQWLRNRMKFESNPILYIHPKADSYVSFDQIVSGPYAKKEEISKLQTYVDNPFGEARLEGIIVYPDNLDDYLRIGDIVWVERLLVKKYYHVAIYLGNKEIIQIEAGQKGTRFANWKDFLNNAVGKLFVYHPIIPFKNYQKIIEQIVKARQACYGLDNYDLYNDNCEHFANAIVFGIYYSKQIKDLENNHTLQTFVAGTWRVFKRFFGGTLPVSFNNNKGSTIKLIDEINETNNIFDNLTSINEDIKNRIESYEVQYRAQIEAPIKTSDCIVM